MATNFPSVLLNNEEMLSQLRARYQAWANIGFPDCDPLLLDFLPKLNANPNIVTVFGCEGHFDEHSSNKFYLMFAVNDEGMQILVDLFSYIIKELGHDFELRCGLDFRIGHSGNCLKYDNTSYPTVILECWLETPFQQAALFSVLAETLYANPNFK
jgi:hypothetical protein